MDEQVDMIREGKRQLESVSDTEITSFIPPFNLADSNTLRALVSNGMRQVLVGQTYIKNKDEKIQQILTGVEHFHFLSTPLFDLMILFPFRIFFQNTLLTVLFHPYNFKEISNNHFKDEQTKFSIDFQALNLLLSKIRKNNIELVWGADLERYAIRVNNNIFFKLMSEYIKKRYGYRVLFLKMKLV